MYYDNISMLCSFSVKNYRGFKDTVTLDLSSSNYDFSKECIRDGYAHKALIYGYNGVGKTNFGFAIMDIVINLTDKEKSLLLTKNYCNAEVLNGTVEFKYKFKFHDSLIDYHYGKTSAETILFEYLNIDNKCIVSYNRQSDDPLLINLPGTETLNKDLNKIPISIVKYIKSNAALDTTPERDVLFSFFDFVDRMLFFRNLDDRTYAGYEVGYRDIFDDIIMKKKFNGLVNFLASAEVPSNIECYEIGGKNKVYFVYETEKHDKSIIDFFQNCSTGMKSLSVLFYWLQNALFNDSPPPSFVYIDEFDAFYHQRLSEFVIKTIKEIKDCQFILTTHDTSVMSNDIMRPDCLFLMYKDKIRSVADSTNKELRLAHNIEKIYRSGALDE